VKKRGLRHFSIVCLVVGITLGLGFCACREAAGGEDFGNETTPLSDAGYVWHMSDNANAAGPVGGLQANGPVQFGVPLEGSEQAESLARGGDGKAARFEGGYLAPAGDAELTINPKQWTVAVRLRDTKGEWLHPILGSYGSDQQVSFALRGRDARSMPMTDRNLWGNQLSTAESWVLHPDGPRTVHGHSAVIEALWGAKKPDPARLERVKSGHPEEKRPNPLFNDVSNAVMRVNFPVGLIGARDWRWSPRLESGSVQPRQRTKTAAISSLNLVPGACDSPRWATAAVPCEVVRPSNRWRA